MNQLRMYKGMLLLPFGLIITGILFLVLVQHWVFELITWVGYAIILAITIGCAILFFFNWRIRSLLGKGQKPRRRLIFGNRFFSAIALIAIIFFTFIDGLTLAAIHYNTGPVLTWNTDQDPQTAITVLWRTTQPKSSIVYYGDTPNSLTQQSSTTDISEWHMVALTDLSPATTYYYRVEGQNPSAIYNFTTAPVKPTNFSFLVFSDPRQNDGQFTYEFRPNIAQAMAQQMSAQHISPAFTLSCGDITGEAVNWVTWKSWFDDLTTSRIGTQAPVQVAIGNHERHGEYSGEIFNQFYPYSNRPNFYYSFNYSSIHVVCLDPWNATNGWWGTFDSAQLTWLEADLQRAASLPYTIIALHPTPILRGIVDENLRPLVNLCKTYKVDAVFFGHEHEFALTELDGTQYYMIGVAGNNQANPVGFIQVDVTNFAMEVSMRWGNNTKQPLGTIQA